MPLSPDPDKRQRQLDNLRPQPDNLVPGAGAWQPGATPALRHGLRTRQPAVQDVEPVLAAVIEDLERKVPEPLLDAEGHVLPWATESVWTLGVLKLGIVRCDRYLTQHGHEDERGRWRPENEALERAVGRYRRALSEEAMTLRSRLQAGLDIARAVDLSTAMSEPDPTRRRAMLADVGLEDQEESA